MNKNNELSTRKLIWKNLVQFFSMIIPSIKKKKQKCSDALYRTLLDMKKSEYEDFTPAKEIENGEEYLNALEWALRNQDVKNIALSGPYGSGKSSIIQSYMHLHPSVKALNISLATFDIKKEQDQGLTLEKENEIELGILKQLFYKVNAKEIPQSRYRKLHKVKLFPYVKKIGVISILGILIVGFFLGGKIEPIFDFIITNGNYWELGKSGTITFMALCWIAGVLILSLIFRCITTRFHLKEVNLADKATLSEEKEDKESIFNKNVDEIVYFFEETKYDTVFIEDLDRFESTRIFVKLRELNTILNNYDLITRRIVFIYAVKDDMFINNERTKFFDFIIPVIPVINSTNSGEILRTKLNVVKGKDGTYKSTKYNISSRFITLVSPYIEDMRVLTSICNEFLVYKRTLMDRQSLDLKDDHMFSMMIFKNLYPKDFADLEVEKGIVKKAFKDKKEFVSKKIDELNEENRSLRHMIDNIENDIFQDLQEVKVVFFSYLTGNIGTGNIGLVRSIQTKNGTWSLPEMMANEFDMNQLKKGDLHVNYYTTINGNTSTNVVGIEKELKENGRNYFERCENLKNDINERKEELRKRIECNDREKMVMRSYSIKKLIDKYLVTDVLSEEVCCNKLLVFLIRNGFLDECYADYINYFRPNSITKDEMNFIIGVRNFEAVGDYSYELKNCEQILDRIEDYEFKQTEVLNYNIFDYILTYKKDTKKYRVLMQQMSNQSDTSKEFIKSYIARDMNIASFINALCKYNDTLWYNFLEDNSLTKQLKYQYLALILLYADIEDIQKYDTAFEDEDEDEDEEIEEISTFIENRKDILQYLNQIPLEKMEEIIKGLDIYFSNIDIEGVNQQLLEYIFENRFYVLNQKMLSNIFAIKCPEKMDALFLANYKTIRGLAYQPLMFYIYQDFVEYVKKFVLNSDTNVQEDLASVEDILEKLYMSYPDICLKVIDKEQVVWEELQNCCKGCLKEETKKEVQPIWNHLLEVDRIMPTWKNYNVYHEQYGLTTELLKYVDRHVSKFIDAQDDSLVTDEMIKEIIIENLSIDAFRLIIKSYKLREFTNTLDEFSNEKIGAMISERYFPFTVTRLIELRHVSPDRCIEFIMQNKEDFMEVVENSQVSMEEIYSLLSSDEFTNDDKNKILKLVDCTEIDEKLALIIREFEFDINKEYVEAAWNKLENSKKYQLLLNQVQVYSLEELELKFRDLDGVYLQLVDRSKRRKVQFAKTEFNEKLLYYLKEKKYLTSVSVEDSYEEDLITHQKNKVSNIVGWIKQK